jgi:hypothetical protein
VEESNAPVRVIRLAKWHAMKALLFACIALATCSALAQEKEKLPPINPDRPDFTDGPGIVPFAKWLLETGYRQTHGAGSTLRQFGDEPMLRYGFRSNLELRLGLPDYAISGAHKGFEDSSFGVKWLVRDGGDGKGWKSPSFVVEAGATVPTGSRAFRANRFQPSAIGIVDWDFGAAGELGVNVGATAAEDTTTWSASLSFDREVTNRISGFVESYAFFAEGAPADHFADTGALYLLNNDCMLDAFVGCQLDRHRQTAFFGAGISFRF